MKGREKIIEAVETAFEIWIGEYDGCSWFKKDEVIKAKEDVIKLLKPVVPEMEGGGNMWYPVCGECHGYINDTWKFCPECGRAVKWE